MKFNREKVSVKSVPYSGYLEEGIGYIKLRSFTKNCSNDIKNAIKELKSKNTLKGLVLDLRGNPGGLLNESVNIVNFFVKEGIPPHRLVAAGFGENYPLIKKEDSESLRKNRRIEIKLTTR